MLKARRRLRLIAVAAYGLAFKRRLVGMLVIPMLTWAGGFASISNDTLEALVMDFRWLLHKDMAADTPPVLCYEIADWEAHPGFARDLSALRCAIRLHSKVPVWIEDASLRLAGRRWPSLLPLTVSTLEQLGWGCDDRGSFVCRRDSFGQVRSFEVGVGSVAVLVEWLRDVYRRRGLEQCRRVTRLQHRAAEDGLAQGLVLPGPPAGCLAVFQGHRWAWRTSSSMLERRCALVTGCSAWHKQKRCALWTARRSFACLSLWRCQAVASTFAVELRSYCGPGCGCQKTAAPA